MNDHAADIKSMKLYSHVTRVYNELDALGKTADASLSTEELTAFDQLHYHGTEAVDYAIEKIAVTADTTVLEIGSGLGGPARHIAAQTGAQVTALELQSDQDKVAADLTTRCEMSGNPTHLCGDFLTHDWRDKKFDAIVSWLAIYHIPNRARLLEIAADLLPSGGAFYTEDLFSRQPFDAAEWSQLSRGLYARHLPDFAAYQTEFQRAGFVIVEATDLSDDWREFTAARLAAYQAARARHIRVHGEPTYNAMQEFYQFVVDHFATGKLGGIRLLARKA